MKDFIIGGTLTILLVFIAAYISGRWPEQTEAVVSLTILFVIGGAVFKTLRTK